MGSWAQFLRKHEYSKPFGLSALERIATIIGNRYSGSGITEFFKKAGLPYIQHDGTTKWRFVYTALQELQQQLGPSQVAKIIELLCNPQEYFGQSEYHQQMVEHVNEVLSFYSLKVDKKTGEILIGPSISPSLRSQRSQLSSGQFDVFIAHASEDKNFVTPLASALTQRNLKVWYDDFILKLGDSLRREIDKGLAQSRYGVVVLSHNFFLKHWPQKELDGLAATEQLGTKVILPVWHNINKEEVVHYSPTLADIVAVKSIIGIEAVVTNIIKAISI